MTELPMEIYLLDMPHEILFEIFRELPKRQLFDISRFSSKFGNVARDARLWKDVYIKYKPTGHFEGTHIYAFEELYSGPFPVKVIDLRNTLLKAPVSFETDQVVKVTELNLSSVRAKKVTVEAMLAKYQCTKLHLDYLSVHPHGHVMSIAPTAFIKQTGLEVLSLKSRQRAYYHDEERDSRIVLGIVQWLVTVLSKYCKNLKSLDLSYNNLIDLDLAFVKSLPTTLEKLRMASRTCPGNSFFELLAEHRPNLKEIGLRPERVQCPALLQFKYLEALHIFPSARQDIRDLYKYLNRFPALKKVHVKVHRYYSSEKNFKTLRTNLEPHGIVVVRVPRNPRYPIDSNLWHIWPRAI